jgi:hypothetical protein
MNTEIELINAVSNNDIPMIYQIYLADFNKSYKFINVTKSSINLGCQNNHKTIGYLNSPTNVYDLFLFGGEFNTLEIRMKTINIYITKFIIIEWSYTHKGHYKGCLLNNSKIFINFEEKIEYHCFNINNSNINHEMNNVIKYFKSVILRLNIEVTDWLMISHVDEIPDISSCSSLKYCQMKEKYYHSDGVFIYGDINHIYDTIYVKENITTYPFPIYWEYGYLLSKIDTISHHKFQICFENCPKLSYGVHLSPWPNIFQEILKYSECSECSSRDNKEIIDFIIDRSKKLILHGKSISHYSKEYRLPSYLEEMIMR